MHRRSDAPDFSEFTEQDMRDWEIQRKKDRIGWLIRALLLLLVVITLGSLGERLYYRYSSPRSTLAGEAWQEGWLQVGKKLGVDMTALPEGWSLDYNQEVSLSDKVYMALLGYGPAETVDYLDRDGKTAQRSRYAAGFYIMARGSGSKAACEADCEEWKKIQQEVCEEWEQVQVPSAGGQETALTWEVYRYTYRPGSSEDYDGGVIAYVHSGGWAYAFQLDRNGRTGEEAEEEMRRLLAALRFAA